MHSPKHCLPGSGWEIWNYASTDIPAGDESFTINKYSISHEGERRLVLYWYQSKNRIICPVEYMGKVLLARDTLLQNSTAASIVPTVVPDQPAAFGRCSATLRPSLFWKFSAVSANRFAGNYARRSSLIARTKLRRGFKSIPKRFHVCGASGYWFLHVCI